METEKKHSDRYPWKFKDDPKIIYIFYGPPASGKSILARTILKLDKGNYSSGFDNKSYVIYEDVCINSNFIKQSIEDIQKSNYDNVFIFTNCDKIDVEVLVMDLRALLKDKYLISVCKIDRG